MRRIFDISPPISEALAVWPGDTPLRREVLLDMNRGDNVSFLGSGPFCCFLATWPLRFFFVTAVPRIGWRERPWSHYR
jgi:hypothetical protein